MTTRLFAVLVIGLLLSMSGLACADVRGCSAPKRCMVVAPATASSMVATDRYFPRGANDAATRRLSVCESAAWGTMINCRGATLEEGRGTINEKRDMLESIPRNTNEAGPEKPRFALSSRRRPGPILLAQKREWITHAARGGRYIRLAKVAHKAPGACFEQRTDLKGGRQGCREYNRFRRAYPTYAGMREFESYSRFSNAPGPDVWGRPRGMSALLWALAQARAAEPLRPSKIDFKEPVLYSLSLMAIGFGGFAAIGAFDDSPSLDNFIESYKSPPQLDNDPPLVNFVLHPLWGSETYLRAREAHFGVYGSIAFSMGASVVWEYLFESWAAHPSTQDLILTTGIGWMIGEGRYYLKNKLGPEHYWWIDPIHTALEYFNIGVRRDREGNTQTTLRLSWAF